MGYLDSMDYRNWSFSYRFVDCRNNKRKDDWGLEFSQESV